MSTVTRLRPAEELPPRVEFTIEREDECFSSIICSTCGEPLRVCIECRDLKDQHGQPNDWWFLYCPRAHCKQSQPHDYNHRHTVDESGERRFAWEPSATGPGFSPAALTARATAAEPPPTYAPTALLLEWYDAQFQTVSRRRAYHTVMVHFFRWLAVQQIGDVRQATPHLLAAYLAGYPQPNLRSRHRTAIRLFYIWLGVPENPIAGRVPDPSKTDRVGRVRIRVFLVNRNRRHQRTELGNRHRTITITHGRVTEVAAAIEEALFGTREPSPT